MSVPWTPGADGGAQLGLTSDRQAIDERSTESRHERAGKPVISPKRRDAGHAARGAGSRLALENGAVAGFTLQIERPFMEADSLVTPSQRRVQRNAWPATDIAAGHAIIGVAARRVRADHRSARRLPLPPPHVQRLYHAGRSSRPITRRWPEQRAGRLFIPDIPVALPGRPDAFVSARARPTRPARSSPWRCPPPACRRCRAPRGTRRARAATSPSRCG